MTRKRKTEVRKKRRLKELNTEQALKNSEMRKREGGSGGSASSSRHSVLLGGPIGPNE